MQNLSFFPTAIKNPQEDEGEDEEEEEGGRRKAPILYACFLLSVVLSLFTPVQSWLKTLFLFTTRRR